MNGLINIHKEKGFTSHDVVNIVRKRLKCKAGHTGTLDPNATGVLPVCLGRATKIADYVMGGDKEYVAEIIFGAATDTQDITGKITSQSNVCVDLSMLNSILPEFIGQINQVPPMYSALKFEGKKLYTYAREGIEVKRKERQITIFGLDILESNLPKSARIRVRCTKGTYIRTLCADIGERLGSFAFMGDLIRTKSGNFCIDNSIKLNQLDEIINDIQTEQYIQSIEKTLEFMPKIYINPNAEKLIINGNKIPFSYVKFSNKPDFKQEYLAFNTQGNLAGIYILDTEGTHIKPKTLLLEERK